MYVKRRRRLCTGGWKGRERKRERTMKSRRRSRKKEEQEQRTQTKKIFELESEKNMKKKWLRRSVSKIKSRK